jgi:hypothetical protein
MKFSTSDLDMAAESKGASSESDTGCLASRSKSAPSSVLASRSMSFIRLKEKERTAVSAAMPTVMAEINNSSRERFRRLSRQAILSINRMMMVLLGRLYPVI